MLRGMTLAAVALVLAGPAMAEDACLADAAGAPCDKFIEQHRSDEVPVGTIDVWSKQPFVVDRLGSYLPDGSVEARGTESVLYWDGDSAMIVPEETGARVEITDW